MKYNYSYSGYFKNWVSVGRAQIVNSSSLGDSLNAPPHQAMDGVMRKTTGREDKTEHIHARKSVRMLDVGTRPTMYAIGFLMPAVFHLPPYRYENIIALVSP